MAERSNAANRISTQLYIPAHLYYSYIIKSTKDDRYYYGHTKYIEKRLLKHNAGQVVATKYRIPFVLHFFEIFETRIEATQRELFYKSIDGYNYLKQNKII